MKRFIILLITIALCSSAFAQKNQEENSNNSKSVEFSEKSGTLFLKEFYDLGKIKGIECQVLIITNMVNNEKIGCLRLKTSSMTKYGTESFIGTLDLDEIDGCLKSLNYMKDNIFTKSYEEYTECSYKSRDGVEFSGFCSKGKWTNLVYVKANKIHSAAKISNENIVEFIDVINKAKNLIHEKTK